MKPRNRKCALAAITLGAVAALPATAVQANDTSAEIRLLKARLRQLEEKVAKQDREVRKATNVANAAAHGAAPCKDAHCPTPPPPVLVSFKNGLFVETLDKGFTFKLGGRVFVDGGGSSQPFLGRSGGVGVRRGRLEAEGVAFKFWHYKMQYDFASGTPAGTVSGGIRDAYLALKGYPGLDPVFLQVGSFFEPMSLDALTSSKYIDFIERAQVVDVIAPFRHIGVGAGAYGHDWTVKAGFYTNSFEDRGLAPARGIPVPFGVPATAGWVSTGGGPYFDITGRATYAPIMEKDRLLHIGAAARYHRPNDATAADDNRVLAPGSNVRSLANVLGENLIGTVDLSCGAVPSYNGQVGAALVAGKCVKSVVSYGAEISAAYGPFAVQAEYMGSHYERNPNALAFANSMGVFSPGGTSVDVDGFYAYATWYLTGESRAASYHVHGLNGAEFGQIHIKDPFSSGGWGAWELGVRYSSINLNSGPFSGSTYSNLVAFAPNNFVRAAVANAGVVGGRQDNLTVGLNWYPDKGVRFMANWVRVMNLRAPWDRAYLNGAHPNIFVVRAQVDW
jgi:phosphate-selective porin OprO/OprP